MNELLVYSETGQFPEYKDQLDRGADIRATKIELQWVGTEPVLVYSTGIHIYSPYMENLELRPRSSIGTNVNLYLTNGIGTIDNGYTGELKFVFALRGYRLGLTKPKVSLYNEFLEVIHEDGFEQMFTVYQVGDRIGQLVVGDMHQTKIVKVNRKEFELINTTRSNKGFGSTGQK